MLSKEPPLVYSTYLFIFTFQDHPESSDSDSDSLPSSLVSIDRAEISDCDTTGHPEPRSEPDVAYTVIGYRNRTTVGIAVGVFVVVIIALD